MLRYLKQARGTCLLIAVTGVYTPCPALQGRMYNLLHQVFNRGVPPGRGPGRRKHRIRGNGTNQFNGDTSRLVRYIDSIYI